MTKQNEIVPIIEVEEDEPFDFKDSSKLSEEEAPKHTIESLEDKVNAYSKIHEMEVKDKAIELIKITLFLLLSMFLIDTIVININGKTSSLLSGLFELLKITVSTLIGFSFANKIEK